MNSHKYYRSFRYRQHDKFYLAIIQEGFYNFCSIFNIICDTNSPLRYGEFNYITTTVVKKKIGTMSIFRKILCNERTENDIGF